MQLLEVEQQKYPASLRRDVCKTVTETACPRLKADKGKKFSNQVGIQNFRVRIYTPMPLSTMMQQPITLEVPFHTVPTLRGMDHEFPVL